MNKTITLSLLFAGIAASAQKTNTADVERDIAFEKYDVAKKNLHQLLKEEPNQGLYYYYLGKIHLIENRSDSATIYFKDGLRVAKNAFINNVGLGEIGLNEAKEKEARSKFNAAMVDVKRNDNSISLKIAQAYLDSSKPVAEKAAEFAAKAYKEKANVEAKVMLGDAYLADKSSKLATTAYKEALALDPKSALALTKIANVYIYNKDYPNAIEKLAFVVQENPEYAPAYKLLAEANYLWNKEEKDSNKINEAVKAYANYHRLIGESLDSDNNFAEFMIKIKAFDPLQDFAQSKWLLRGDNFAIYKYAAIAAYEKGQYEEALTNINKYFDVMDTNAPFKGIDYLYLGLAEIANSKSVDGVFDAASYNTGLTNIKKGLAMDKSLAEAMNANALELFNKGSYEQAYYLFDLGTYDVNSPNLVSDLFYKGNCLFLTYEKPMFPNQLAMATAALQEAIKVSPTTHEALYLDGRVNRYLNTPASKVQMEKSYENFVKALQSKKMLNAPQFKDALVEAYMFIGDFNVDKDKAKAKANFQKVLELVPNHEYSINSLKKIN